MFDLGTKENNHSLFGILRNEIKLLTGKKINLLYNKEFGWPSSWEVTS